MIYTPPGEWHWQDAAPDHFMTHIATWQVDDEGQSAIRGAHVGDDAYRKPTQAARQQCA